MIKIILVLIVLFLVSNLKLQENFYQAPAEPVIYDSQISLKLDIYGTNITPPGSIDNKKGLLTLYFDRREENCQYFYDYFSRNYGGENFTNNQLRFEDHKLFSGESQVWNQIKKMYSENDDLINSTNMNIEEIEVDQYDLNNFNKLPAYKIDSNGQKNTKKYLQYYRPNDFLPQIPFITYTVLEPINGNINVDTYDLSKYNMKTYKYQGIYSPNNRAVKSTLENIKDFIRKCRE